ncbi:MAG: LamG-like jellyroll fold domain-containing protein [Myxococcota bacterium]
MDGITVSRSAPDHGSSTRRRWAPLFVGASLIACTGTPARTLESTATTNVGAGGGGGSGGNTDVTTGGGGGSGGRGRLQAGLRDEGLVVRYFLEEVSGGSELVHDAGPAEIDLQILQSGNLQFGGVPGRRGMTWTDAASVDGAVLALGDTRLIPIFSGATELSFEAVLDVTEATPQGSRVIHYGGGDDGGGFSLQVRSPREVTFSMAGATIWGCRWAFDVEARSVLHVVYDGSQAPSDRVRIYGNGRQLTPYFTADAPPQVATGAEDRLWLGNRDGQNRSFIGTLGYAAVYARALDEPTLFAHVERLLVNDDAAED